MSVDITTLITEPFVVPVEETPVVSNSFNFQNFLEQGQRYALIALPFLSLYKPFTFPIALLKSSLAMHNSSNKLFTDIERKNTQEILLGMLESAIAMLDFSGKLLSQTFIKPIKTSYDLVMKIFRLSSELQNGEIAKTVGSSLSIANNMISLIVVFTSLELAITALAVQILMSLYGAYMEHNQEHYPETAGLLLMGTLQTYQVSQKIKPIPPPPSEPKKSENI